MDFYGHAVVASWRALEPPFVLGAMLPDFASMIRARPPPADHAGIAQGIGFHHRTDAVFHDAPAFRELGAAALAWLEARGLRRGSARAVAHVGVEMLLDAAFVDEHAARAAYADALGAARHDALGRLIVWRDDGERARFASLRDALAERARSEPAQGRKPRPEGFRAGPASPEMIAWRLVRALGGRPRLALDGEGEAIVRQWAEHAAPRVLERAPALLDYVRRELGM